MSFKVRIEYERIPIRHVAVQCPSCEKWFHGNDITSTNLVYEEDVKYAEFQCPLCGKEFGGIQNIDIPDIEKKCYPEVYEGCLEKKEVWT